MIAHLWFRRSGHVDGLWWTLDASGTLYNASSVSGLAAFATKALPGPTEDTPLLERRHVVSFECSRLEWSGSAVTVHLDDADRSEPPGSS